MGRVKLISHLFINESRVAPGGEWQDTEPAWRIVFFASGALYWLRRGGAQEVNAGDVLVLNGAAEGVLRVSQLGPAVLHYFYFRPEHLVGMMSISERLSLERLSSLAGARHIPGTEPAAREFAELIAQGAQRRSFFYRCRILNLVAMIFGEAIPAGFAPGGPLPRMMVRFEDVMSRIPDSELMDYPSGKLAELCGCSVRHFRRVFRSQFKTSIRAKQTELRLEKARQLLAETQEKVVDVAQESGYRHLGLFNSMFKKRFGVTPSEWRRQSAEGVGDGTNGIRGINGSVGHCGN